MSRYIDADALIDKLMNAIECGRRVDMPTQELEAVLSDVRNAPSIDIVRCQDCKHWVYNFNGCARNPCTEPWYATDFCNYGEREGE